MTSQTCLQTRAVDTLPSVSQSKGNQTMEFDEMKLNLRRGIFFSKNYAEHYAGRLVPDLFLFY